MSDLKVHIGDSHKVDKSISYDSLPSDFFSEANGFWLAVYPKDYLKMITPNSWRADAAGWEAARSPLLTPEEKFVPDYSKDPEGDLKARKRATECSPPDLTSPTPTSMTPVASPSIKKVLSVVLAVGPEHFKTIRKETCTPVYVPSKMSGACHPQGPPPVPALCTRGDSQRSEPASSSHADVIAPAVPNTTASCPSSFTNSEAPGTSLASSIDLSKSHTIILNGAQTLLEFCVMPLLPPARRN
uniref:Uncharacterized protein n=1 Tax=Magallana gigas TaxID=29159 RepID=K1QR17_MAGGI